MLRQPLMVAALQRNDVAIPSVMASGRGAVACRERLAAVGARPTLAVIEKLIEALQRHIQAWVEYSGRPPSAFKPRAATSGGPRTEPTLERADVDAQAPCRAPAVAPFRLERGRQDLLHQRGQRPVEREAEFFRSRARW